MTRIQGVVVIAGLCLVFAAAGCGGSSSSSSSDESESTTSTTIGGTQVESHGTKDVSNESGKVEIELDDSILPAEAGLDDTHVSFTKGCYPGQEPLARLRHRGKVNRSLRALEVEGAQPGEEIHYGEKVVGRVTSAVGDRALGYVRVEVPAGAEVFVGGKTARTLSA